MIRSSVLRAVFLAASLQACIAVQAAPAYNAPVALSQPGYTSTQVWGINDSGVIVGSSSDATSGVGFIYSNGVFTSFERQGADYVGLTGISADGTLVGTSTRVIDEQNFVTESFIYSAGTFTTFAVAGANDTTIRGISSNGRYIAGVYNGSSAGFIHDRLLGATRLVDSSNALTVILQGVNDSGVAVGNRFESVANGVLNIGFTVDAATGTFNDLVGPGGEVLRPRGINNDGVMAGMASNRAFVGSPADGWLLDMAPLPAGYTSAFGYGINSSGTVIGYYSGATGVQSWVATPVPEPAAWALMALGLAAVGAAARRRA